MNHSIVFTPQQRQLLSLLETPVVYWLSEKLLSVLLSTDKLTSHAYTSKGLGTCDDKRFVRMVWEVSDRIRWNLLSKGGQYKKWSGLAYYMVENEKERVHIVQDLDRKFPYFRGNFGLLIHDPEWYDFSGIVYSEVGRGAMGARFKTSGQIVGHRGPAVYPLSQDTLFEIMGILNSRLSSFLFRSISSSLLLDNNYIGSLPVRLSPDSLVSTLAHFCWQISQFQSSVDETEEGFNAAGIHLFTRMKIEPKGNVGFFVLDAYRLAVEAMIDHNVNHLFSISETDAQAIIGETGTPSGWHPLIVGHDALPDLPPDLGLPPLPPQVLHSLTAHQRIQPGADELARIAANLQSLYEAGPGAKADDLELDNLAHQDDEGAASGAYIPISTETFLEELSVKLQIHPISVYWLLEELRAGGVRCKPEELRLLEDRLSVLVLRLLGHRWPKQMEAGEPVPSWADRDGIIPLTPGLGEATLAERIRSRLRAEEGDLGAQRTEALLHELTGRSLEEWLRRDFFKRHASQFKKRPIAWHLVSDPSAAGRKKSAQPAFECLVYYHATSGYTPLLERGGGGEILARLRTQYVDRLLAPAQRELAQARRDANESAAAQANGLIQELEDFARRLRQVEETGFACPELEASLADEALDRWAGDGVFPPASRGELHAQEAAWQVDINDGVRVNVAPVQAAGLLAGDVLAKKDVSKAIVDRARWRSDERRWVRAGKLPRCGWLGDDVPESPRWTELAPEREKERLRLEEKRAKVLAELGEK